MWEETNVLYFQAGVGQAYLDFYPIGCNDPFLVSFIKSFRESWTLR